ncbi:MAG TPA: dienelactone hydrolase family protein [Rhizomicrobium sp.]|jgi:carboxymethylenebutenolidase|nr:dienelactone hydrolase family protein [Rhizomicrobium sp.]
MDQTIIDLYDDYVHHHFDRRLFLDRLTKYTGGMSAALALLPLLQSNYALAETVKEDDPRITARWVEFPGATGPVKAYLAEPKGTGRHGGVVVVHQNRGLNPHIQDIARRLATEGYVALAVDFLSPLGGTPADENAAMQMFAKLDPAQTTANAVAAVAYLRSLPQVNGKIGAVGFCWGGGVINQLAVNDQTLDAGAVYYGTPPKPEEASKVHAVLLLNYADPALDKRNGELAPGWAAALKAQGKLDGELNFYSGAQHAFNDDTNAARYNKEAADLAWSRTLALFKRTLS